MIMVKDWGMQILCGLHYFHHEADDTPILHCDLKLTTSLYMAILDSSKSATLIWQQ
jgi:hypothetical protein